MTIKEILKTHEILNKGEDFYTIINDNDGTLFESLNNLGCLKLYTENNCSSEVTHLHVEKNGNYTGVWVGVSITTPGKDGVAPRTTGALAAADSLEEKLLYSTTHNITAFARTRAWQIAIKTHFHIKERVAEDLAPGERKLRKGEKVPQTKQVYHTSQSMQLRTPQPTPQVASKQTDVQVEQPESNYSVTPANKIVQSKDTPTTPPDTPSNKESKTCDCEIEDVKQPYKGEPGVYLCGNCDKEIPKSKHVDYLSYIRQ